MGSVRPAHLFSSISGFLRDSRGAPHRQGRRAAAGFSTPVGGPRGLAMNAVEQLEFPGGRVRKLHFAQSGLLNLRIFNGYCSSTFSYI